MYHDHHCVGGMALRFNQPPMSVLSPGAGGPDKPLGGEWEHCELLRLQTRRFGDISCSNYHHVQISEAYPEVVAMRSRDLVTGDWSTTTYGQLQEQVTMVYCTVLLYCTVLYCAAGDQGGPRPDRDGAAPPPLGRHRGPLQLPPRCHRAPRRHLRRVSSA